MPAKKQQVPEEAKTADIPQGVSVTLKPSKTEAGWLLFRVEGIGVNISRRVQTDDYTVWMKLANPHDHELIVADQLYPGVGPAPEDSILMIDLEDRLFKMLDAVDSAIDRHVANKKQGEEWS